MVFECQRDPYKKQFKSIVKSCIPADYIDSVTSNKEHGYDIQLEDTILFPEGGGQPDDRGTIADICVHRVARKGAEAHHYTGEPLEVGTEVDIKVDWVRRFDHMQQHSGQHLITAVIDNLFGFGTTSWNLGQYVSYIELDTPSLTEEQITTAENKINEFINNCTNVVTTIFNSVDDIKSSEVRTRGLPDDHVGQVRIVTIQGLDSNMCCGTHVSNMKDLQVVKLLHTEKAKKAKTLLYFVVGNRVLKHFGTVYGRERHIMTLLKCSAQQSIPLVEKLQKTLKLTQKNISSLTKDLATLEAHKFKQINPRPKHLFLHRRDAEPEFMMRIINEINDPDVTAFLSVGEDKGQGQIMLAGPKHIVDQISPKMTELLGAKGFYKDSKYQAKVSNLSKRNIIEKNIIELLNES